MKDQDFRFFKELVEAPSPSGFEQPAQRTDLTGSDAINTITVCELTRE